jgi:hypothetical protein
MDVRVLDLDGGIVAQSAVIAKSEPKVVSLQDWGPAIRLACRFGVFSRFEQALAKRLGQAQDNHPWLTLYGSGDFHHVSLALLRRLGQPFNVLVLDKHPDWMRGVPILHCGTWLHNALRLANVDRVFHLGGDLDFDNSFRWLAPWKHLGEGKVVAIPALRRYSRGRWRSIATEPLRPRPDQLLTGSRLDTFFGAARADLGRLPLYISLDKDVMRVSDAIVNWDSGHLELTEVRTILNWFIAAANHQLIGMDIVGDWSPVRVRGWVRRLLHWTEHPRLAVETREAGQINARSNLALLDCVQAQRSSSSDSPWPSSRPVFRVG